MDRPNDPDDLQSWLEPLHAWSPFYSHLLNERSAVDSLLFPVKLEA